MENCVFCKIISGEWSSLKVYESETTLAFLDINPLSEGHTVVVPKKHVVEITDITSDVAGEFFSDLIKATEIIKSKLTPDGINIVQNNGKAAGQEVLHAHFHIIPRTTGDGIIKLKTRENKMTQEELTSIHQKLL